MRFLLLLSIGLVTVLARAGSVDVRQEAVDGQAVTTVNDNFRRLGIDKIDKRQAGTLVEDAISDGMTTTTLDATTITASSITVTNFVTAGWLAAPYPMLIVRDEKSSGTNGGTFTSGAWQQRTLNTTSTNTISGASLSSNQITLPAGTYYVRWSAPAYANDEHQSRFVSTPTATIAVYGTSEHTNSTVFLTTKSDGSGVFDIGSSTTFQLEHRCQTTRATDGFGDANTFGNTQVYAVVEIWKLR